MALLLREKEGEIESFKPNSFVFSIAVLPQGEVGPLCPKFCLPLALERVTVDDSRIFGGRLIGLPEPSRSLH